MNSRHILIRSHADTMDAAMIARDMTGQLSISRVRQTAMVTAVSELGTNIIKYAGRGTITLRIITQGPRRGVEAVVEDNGPGIADIEEAMRDRTSTGGTLGLGLPGTRRLVDDFDIQSAPDQGTRVHIIMWAS